MIDAGEFEVEWLTVNAPSEKGKVELLGKMTSAMQQAFQAGLVEIRDAQVRALTAQIAADGSLLGR